MDDVPVPGTHAPEPEGVTRRRFYIGAIYGLCAAMAAALGLPAAIYLLFPPRLRENDQWVEVGDVTRLAANSPAEMTFRRNRVDGWKITSEKATAWVVRQADDSVVAFGPQCTHLGCAYHWDDGKAEFLCPCHNSLFSIEGKVLGGPAPRPLDRYETRIEGHKLLLGRLIAPEQES
jgi:menaquinol-cytochrome c reductase iron-sulfur subunit